MLHGRVDGCTPRPWSRKSGARSGCTRRPRCASAYTPCEGDGSAKSSPHRRPIKSPSASACAATAACSGVCAVVFQVVCVRMCLSCVRALGEECVVKWQVRRERQRAAVSRIFSAPQSPQDPKAAGVHRPGPEPDSTPGRPGAERPSTRQTCSANSTFCCCQRHSTTVHDTRTLL